MKSAGSSAPAAGGLLPAGSRGRGSEIAPANHARWGQAIAGGERAGTATLPQGALLFIGSSMAGSAQCGPRVDLTHKAAETKEGTP